MNGDRVIYSSLDDLCGRVRDNAQEVGVTGQVRGPAGRMLAMGV